MSNNQDSMDCPYCKKAFHVNFHKSAKVDPRTSDEFVYDDNRGIRWRKYLHCQDCPACHKLIIVFDYEEQDWETDDNFQRVYSDKAFRREILYPKVTCNRTVAPEVPQQYADDFIEACNVLSVSPYASVMLSRRLLQTILHEKYTIQKRGLQDEIDEFIASQHPPTSLSDYLHALREVGNLGAHPTVDKTTGDKIKVEPEEGEWLLNLLEELFDFAYIKPTRSATMKQSLNQKLQAAGRKTI